MKKLRGLLRIIFGRTTFVVLFLLVQMGVLLAGFNWLREYMIYVYGGSSLLSAVVLIYIISNDENSSIKLSWVVPILVIPVFGTLFYLFLKLQPGVKLINRRIQSLEKGIAPYLVQNEEVLREYNNISSSEGNLARYMNRYGGFPVYQNTNVEYFPLGDDMFPKML